MKIYRNARNTSRSSTVERSALVGEAGEVFTPPAVVKDILGHADVAKCLRGAGLILEPSAGDGNFTIALLTRLLEASIARKATSEQVLEEAARLYSVEIMEDNLSHLRERASDVLSHFLPDVEESAFEAFCRKQYLRGSFLTERACSLSCPSTCVSCERLPLPSRYSLVVGNPPYNPSALYIPFVRKALAQSDVVAFILPTTWKVAPRYKVFREEVAPRLSSVDDLPWKTFAIKLRTCKVVFTENASHAMVNSERTTLVDGEDFKVMNGILRKAFQHWHKTLNDYRGITPHRLSIGWKCNLEKDTGRINYLQSIGFENTPMPNNVYDLYFASEAERLAYVRYSSTKLAAYLQYCVDSDSVARHLPIPPLDFSDYSDFTLYKKLGLTEEEIAWVESFTLFVSARAKSFYDENAISLSRDVVFGRERKTCPSCGSSSFHRKGCENSTDKEKTMRDVVV